MATEHLEHILTQIKLLSFEDKQRLRQWLVEDLQATAPASESSGLIDDKYRDTGHRLSTEEDFKIAEWQTPVETSGETPNSND